MQVVDLVGDVPRRVIESVSSPEIGENMVEGKTEAPV